jgi:hypothetical protein
MERAVHARPTTPQQKSTPPSHLAYARANPPCAFAASLDGRWRDSTVEEEPARPEGPAEFRFGHDFSRFTIYPTPARKTKAPSSLPDQQAQEAAGMPRPLQGEPVPYRARMEQAFGTDFSTVNAFCGETDLLAPYGARAAAWPEAVAFTSAVPSPGVVAHELAHVLQYRHSQYNTTASSGVIGSDEPAEAEARHAAAHFGTGMALRPEARPQAMPMLYTDEEDLDSEEYLQERPPQFMDQQVGTWGNSFPATLIARERFDVSYPEAERSHAIVEAIAQREPMVIVHEYGRLWLYRLEWEGVSARYSRFTNAATIFHEGTGERGDYSISNVRGPPEVESFVTEDGGVLSPPGAGKLFLHTGGEFEDPLVSRFQNAAAFVGGLCRGLEQANFAELADRLRRMAALNSVFPAPFAIGAVHGLTNEIVELAQWLNPQQWKAIEAAARQTILMLSDPDGEELAVALGEEFGRTQAATLDTLLQQSLPIFAYEVGKLVGPTVVEIVLAFIGIEIGPLTVIRKSLDAIENVPRLAGMLRGAQMAFPDIPDRPGFPGKVEGESAVVEGAIMEGAPDRDFLPSTPPNRTLPDLSQQEQELLVRTGNRTEFPGALPKDLADQELAIVKRADKVSITELDGKYVNEVDLGNGHKWKEQPNGTWCRFSNGATNCTVLIDEPGPQLPGTVVAYAASKSALRDIYFSWAENRAAENVEMALLRSRGTPKYPEGTYAVVVGQVDLVGFPGKSNDWITVAHSHAGAPRQPGFVNPSGADLQASLFGGFGRTGGRIRKWVHSQTPEGEWREVEYGLDWDTKMYYIQPSGGEPIFFEELHDMALPTSALREYAELEAAGRRRERIDLMIEQNAIEFYLGWYARQFVFDR